MSTLYSLGVARCHAHNWCLWFVVYRRLGPLLVGHRCIWTLDHRLWTDVPAWNERFDTLAQHQTELLTALA